MSDKMENDLSGRAEVMLRTLNPSERTKVEWERIRTVKLLRGDDILRRTRWCRLNNSWRDEDHHFGILL